MEFCYHALKNLPLLFQSVRLSPQRKLSKDYGLAVFTLLRNLTDIYPKAKVSPICLLPKKLPNSCREIPQFLCEMEDQKCEAEVCRFFTLLEMLTIIIQW